MGPQLPFVVSELLPPGEISFTADPQLGKAVIVANTWSEMCDKAVQYFSLRKPVIKKAEEEAEEGVESTYAECLRRLFGSDAMRCGKIRSNETFSKIQVVDRSAGAAAGAKIPPSVSTKTHPLNPDLPSILEKTVAPVLVTGYRTGEGVDASKYPSENVLLGIEELDRKLSYEAQAPRQTAFSKYARGEIGYDAWIGALRGQLEKQGGGWVTVAPR